MDQALGLALTGNGQCLLTGAATADCRVPRLDLDSIPLDLLLIGATGCACVRMAALGITEACWDFL